MNPESNIYNKIMNKLSKNISQPQSVSMENQIIQKINQMIKYPDCFTKDFCNKICTTDIEHAIKRTIIKNIIYTNAKTFNKTLFLKEYYDLSETDKGRDPNVIIDLSKKYQLPALYLLNTVFKDKYSHTILYINKHKDVMNEIEYKQFVTARDNDNYTLEPVIDSTVLEYKEYVKHFLYLLNIRFCTKDFWFELKDGYNVKWIYYLPSYGLCTKRLYENTFDTNIKLLGEKYPNSVGLIFYKQNYCGGLNEREGKIDYYNVYLPVGNKYLHSIINPDITKHGDFYKFGSQSKTDKVTHHNYYKYYPLFLEKYRHLVKNKPKYSHAMIEIGINHYRSLHLWTKYFQNTYIYGMDIGFRDKKFNYEIFKCDQSNIEQLERVSDTILSEGKEIFFIIDDGSHHPAHQLLTFDLLFDKLLSYGGCYIIEDIETSYWSKNDIYGYKTDFGYLKEDSMVEQSKNLIDDVNQEFMNEESRVIQNKRIGGKISDSTRKLISGIFYAQNNIIIMKKTLDDLEMDYREYRFKDNL